MLVEKGVAEWLGLDVEESEIGYVFKCFEKR